jgi:hypothetical protein
MCPVNVFESSASREGINQAPPLTAYNLYLSDSTLKEAIQRREVKRGN